MPLPEGATVRSLGLITVATLLAITTPARAIEFQAPAQQIKTGSYPEALAHADVTGDGAQELLLVTSFSFDAANDGKLIVYAPHATLGFVESKRFSTHSTSNAARGLAAGDFDGDGDADVAVGLPNGIDHLVQSDAGLADPVLPARQDGQQGRPRGRGLGVEVLRHPGHGPRHRRRRPRGRRHQRRGRRRAGPVAAARAA